MPQPDYSSFQTGIQRFEKAMTGVPDRVPLFAQLHEFAMNEIGAAAMEFYTTPQYWCPGLWKLKQNTALMCR